MQHQHDASGALAGLFAGTFVLVWCVLVLAFVVLSLVVNWRIATKAGYNGALSLLMLIPVVNFVVLLIFAFGEWPIEQRLRGGHSAAPSWQPPATP